MSRKGPGSGPFNDTSFHLASDCMAEKRKFDVLVDGGKEA